MNGSGTQVSQQRCLSKSHANIKVCRLAHTHIHVVNCNSNYYCLKSHFILFPFIGFTKPLKHFVIRLWNEDELNLEFYQDGKYPLLDHCHLSLTGSNMLLRVFPLPPKTNIFSSQAPFQCFSRQFFLSMLFLSSTECFGCNMLAFETV